MLRFSLVLLYVSFQAICVLEFFGDERKEIDSTGGISRLPYKQEGISLTVRGVHYEIEI
jgi:hypothetical protein